MSTDIRRVRSQLAGPERQSLDRYLEAYESMLDRHDGIVGMKDALKANMPNPDKFKSTKATDRLESQCDMAVGALLSGLTNVVTIAACAGPPQESTEAPTTKQVSGASMGEARPDSNRRWRICIRWLSHLPTAP